MKCPYCGGEMEWGVIRDDYGMGMFYVKAKSDKERRQRYPIFGRARRAKKGVILLDGPNWLRIMRVSGTTAMCCRRCQKIIVDYWNQ